jgi:hypothetical protein
MTDLYNELLLKTSERIAEVAHLKKRKKLWELEKKFLLNELESKKNEISINSVVIQSQTELQTDHSVQPPLSLLPNENDNAKPKAKKRKKNLKKTDEGLLDSEPQDKVPIQLMHNISHPNSDLALTGQSQYPNGYHNQSYYQSYFNMAQPQQLTPQQQQYCLQLQQYQTPQMPTISGNPSNSRSYQYHSPPQVALSYQSYPLTPLQMQYYQHLQSPSQLSHSQTPISQSQTQLS